MTEGGAPAAGGHDVGVREVSALRGELTPERVVAAAREPRELRALLRLAEPVLGDVPERRARLVPELREQRHVARPRVLGQVRVDRLARDVMGPNARLNINSSDSSVNVVHTASQLFGEIRSALERDVADPASRHQLLSRLAALESARDAKTRLERYQELVAIAADHITVLAPFLPALAQLLAQ